MALVIEKSGFDRSFRPVNLDELPEELLSITEELPEGCVTLNGSRYRWRPE